MVRAVSPWYLVAWKTSLAIRNILQANDLCLLSLSNLSCRVSCGCRDKPSLINREALDRYFFAHNLYLELQSCFNEEGSMMVRAAEMVYSLNGSH